MWLCYNVKPTAAGLFTLNLWTLSRTTDVLQLKFQLMKTRMRFGKKSFNSQCHVLLSHSVFSPFSQIHTDFGFSSLHCCFAAKGKRILLKI